jgi:serine/threonine protein kinase
MKLSILSVAPEALSQQESEFKKKVEKKAGKRVGYNYIIIKSYKESQKNDVVKCLYIKSPTQFGFCVIKEGSYGDSKDKHGRDIIDRLKWQKQLHEELQDKVCVPRLLGHFEEKGNFYLVIEHIRGKSLQKLCYQNKKQLRQSILEGGKLGLQFLNYIINIAEVLAKLHSSKIVHRDATPNNYMITSKGQVALIDMEMCYSIDNAYPSPAFQLGTYGYMSPQQEATETPTIAEDIYAMGAIVLQIWSNMSPAKFTKEPLDSLAAKIQFFIPDRQIADLVTQCLHPDDKSRPNASYLASVIQKYKEDKRKKIYRPIYKSLRISKEISEALVREGIHTLSSPLLADPEKGWFADNMNPSPNHDKHKIQKVWYASFNRGVAGILFFLTQAKRTSFDISSNYLFVEKGIDLIKEKYINRIKEASTGFHFGSDGIAATLSRGITYGLIAENSDCANWIPLLLEKENDSLDVIYGLAGLGLANLASNAHLDNVELITRLDRYVTKIIQKQGKNGIWAAGSVKKKFGIFNKSKLIFSFGSGIAGIVYFLLEHARFTNRQDSFRSAMSALHFLSKRSVNSKGKRTWLSPNGKELNFGWVEGIAGIALVFIRAYEFTNEPVYKKYAVSSLRYIEPQLIDNSLSQFQGLSGLGEVYLEAVRVFKETEWLERANWIVQVLYQARRQNEKHGIHWLVENERQPVANFMVGNSGVLHFLLRYCYPEQIHFPL